VTGRLEKDVDRWLQARVIDAATAERIRSFESNRDRGQGLHWPVLLAVAFGAILLCAGVLLFVAAHWDSLSPAGRFSLTLAMVALFHLAAALSAVRFPPLSSALHAAGTVSLGAGIFLAAQIFHLQEHWPGGVMLWAVGAWGAWALLRDWPQASLAAILTPVWLAGEWTEATRGWFGGDELLAEGLLLLAITYLTAVLPGRESSVRRSLAWIGGLTLLPLAAAAVLTDTYQRGTQAVPLAYLVAGWIAALALPLALSVVLRGRAAWMNVVAAVWVLLLGSTSFERYRIMAGAAAKTFWELAGFYLVSAAGSIGLIAWGLREVSRERINLGVAGFALTVLAFYFSTVMDKLGRSASLTGLGLLFLLGGWLLEKTRRRLMESLERVN
jgi:uncharacterized membrane protein